LLKLPENPTRKNVLNFLATSASYGNLGLFVGAGFSKAVLNDTAEGVALSWGELLERAAQKMGVDYEAIGKTGVSYPEIASSLCAAHCKHNAKSFASSLQQLKYEIAVTCPRFLTQ
jgi:hypothetical protein